MQTIETDIAIIGAGMGGCAAALAACAAGYHVVLTESTNWVGGQMTAQGVSALDEHKYIEDMPPSRSYADLCNRIRQHYIHHQHMPATLPNGVPLNPGNGWVSRLCFEPRVGLQALQDMLAPHIASGHLQLLLHCEAAHAEVKDDVVVSCTLRMTQPLNDERMLLRARYFLDATELGDLLPLTHTAFVTGAESQADTGEPSAPHTADPNASQGFTFCFAVEHRAGENHTIQKTPNYERMRDAQPFALSLINRENETMRYFFWRDNVVQGLLPFWTYRRLFDASLPTHGKDLRDIALINWASNDYFGATLTPAAGALGQADLEAVIADAKNLSLGFLYWLQTECPRDDDDGFGYPGLRLLPNVMGTHDGLSKTPYIRESRRIVPLMRVLEQHISARLRNHAELFEDSVGVGWYSIDIHHCVGSNPRDPAATAYAPTHPFQIPLGALIPVRTKNLIAACKNIGTTHLTNGAYRLHPVEWAIGEAAGTLAALCCQKSITPKQVHANNTHTRELQTQLHGRGVRTVWD